MRDGNGMSNATGSAAPRSKKTGAKSAKIAEKPYDSAAPKSEDDDAKSKKTAARSYLEEFFARENPQFLTLLINKHVLKYGHEISCVCSKGKNSRNETSWLGEYSDEQIKEFVKNWNILYSVDKLYDACRSMSKMLKAKPQWHFILRSHKKDFYKSPRYGSGLKR